ncbi:expressed unknown protein [Seminavis robusta]|uniref:Uncharacterized protein n=1 Tax=Seminavis robusta TaxID=568900 RepID=A0A9N8DKW8_9STRA|nr:expressed unknown protein [Seminavis robusta]|eukprot:Sro141_g065800.1 n/a (620) ;mRNA; r:42382-44241
MGNQEPQDAMIADVMQCSTNATDIAFESCCAPWDTLQEEAIDHWWTHHPDWEEVSLNNNSTVSSSGVDQQVCFARMRDPERAAFFRALYALQFPHPDGHDNLCGQDLQVHQINAGYGASVSQVARGLWAAHNQRRPFQMTKHWDGARWLFSTNLTDRWNYCPSMDMNCYFLPLSSCSPVVGRDDVYSKSATNTASEKQRYQWTRQYVTRPRHRLRKQLRQVLKEHLHGLSPLSLQNNCTVIHVRRGDVGYPRHPFRRYAAVQEYLDIGNVTEGSTVVLLTDDETTIHEVQKYHDKNYQWVYLDRPRNNGIQGGMDGHIPSGDEGYEILMIMAEVKLASQCHTLVHGKSGFVATIKDEMDAAGQVYQSVYLDTSVPDEEIKKWRRKHDPKGRVELMMDHILQRHDNTTRRTIDNQSNVPPNAIIKTSIGKIRQQHGSYLKRSTKGQLVPGIVTTIQSRNHHVQIDTGTNNQGNVKTAAITSTDTMQHEASLKRTTKGEVVPQEQLMQGILTTIQRRNRVQTDNKGTNNQGDRQNTATELRRELRKKASRTGRRRKQSLATYRQKIIQGIVTTIQKRKGVQTDTGTSNQGNGNTATELGVDPRKEASPTGRGRYVPWKARL